MRRRRGKGGGGGRGRGGGGAVLEEGERSPKVRKRGLDGGARGNEAENGKERGEGRRKRRKEE